MFPIHIDSSCPHWVLGLVEVLEEEDDKVQCNISEIDSANYEKYDHVIFRLTINFRSLILFHKKEFIKTNDGDALK